MVGHLPGQGACHTQIELSADAHYVLLHLASTARFGVALPKPSAARLLGVLAEPEPCRIAVRHGDVGAWLAVRPHSHAVLTISVAGGVAQVVTSAGERLLFSPVELGALTRKLEHAAAHLAG